MTRKICNWPLLFVPLVELSLSAVVLPRPPSSPNHIPGDFKTIEPKFYNEKAFYSQNTNVEKPETDNYSLLEIELQGTDPNVMNLQGLLQAVLKHDVVGNESRPNPEIVPNSILGVRNVGPGTNFRTTAFTDVEDKSILLSPLRIRDLDEKLYYLKTGKPKVYVNLRSRGGSFQRDSTASPEDGFLRSAQFLDRQKEKLLVTKSYRPKKFYSDRGDILPDEESYGTQEYSTRMMNFAPSYDAEVQSTTESSMVTSSELPKQIPAPPSRNPNQALLAQTTPVQKYASHRTDILPGYRFPEE
ncbi:uncharacterized protein LOC105698015 [Orussus abietinus]|uniref:uncharacterized protein LOC105698015 n=1 Tax=Orussus abietinus TaxID=222816 RepID=UPI000625C347|nr:uncharacterized protein LOC105698015 [Orussus abietinus]